jgi:hypothetical protein
MGSEYILRLEPKGGKFACTIMCFEADFEKGLLSKILLTMGE